MLHTGTLITLLSTVAIVGTTAASAWPVMNQSSAPADPIILAQRGGMGGMGGGMGGGGMRGDGGMGGMGSGAVQRPGGMGGGGMGGGGMGGGGMGGMGGMGGNNVNINRNRNTNVYVRGVRPWSSRAWYGTAIAGVTLGTILAVSAVPPVPDDRLCWFWVDSLQTSGYWDWCVPPM